MSKNIRLKGNCGEGGKNWTPCEGNKRQRSKPYLVQRESEKSRVEKKWKYSEDRESKKGKKQHRARKSCSSAKEKGHKKQNKNTTGV